MSTPGADGAASAADAPASADGDEAVVASAPVIGHRPRPAWVPALDMRPAKVRTPRKGEKHYKVGPGPKLNAFQKHQQAAAQNKPVSARAIHPNSLRARPHSHQRFDALRRSRTQANKKPAAGAGINGNGGAKAAAGQKVKPKP